MRKKPYTAEELFEAICRQIKLPDILDYHLSHEQTEVNGYEWDFGNHLDFGGNEGIYLDMYMETRDKRIRLGTFKTLSETPEAMHVMANLLADFILAGRKFVNENLDDFTWEGYKLTPEGQPWSYDCATLERARTRYDELMEKYDKVTVFDYAKRKEVTL